MVELFSFGPFSVHFFGVTIAAGMIAALYLATQEAKRVNLSEDAIFDVVLYSLLGGIIGARLLYILVYDPVYYLTNPFEVFRIQAGGLSIHGGILGGFFLGLWRALRNKLDVWHVADLLAPALILGQAIGRIGCDVFGVPMDKPFFWGVEQNGQIVHPVQAYELTLNYLLFAWLWTKRKSIHYKGQIFVHYLIGFSAIRSIVELFRMNPEVLGLLSVSHLLSFVGILTGLLLQQYLKKRYPLMTREHIPTSLTRTIGITFLLIIISTGLYYFVQG
ncbi:prolipoprotein diacylglyceryl transferase [Heliorestis acidaminivorans]|uniref:prolipoprotein diacylglyceryl transferase n=1 Tax=Heliorestis acidaminivorans TaxID=553427 RepID=UPI001479808F|nr:prolipoprotein diacylglyceryl transferase [Heliorestis acidaminivorans]